MWRNFNPGVPLPSTWTDAIEQLLNGAASANFKVVRATNTTLQVVAGSGNDQVSIAIEGKPRWNTATVTATHPGGGAGTLDVWVTGYDDVFGTDSNGDETQTNSMAFGLKIGAPSNSGAEAIQRKVATVTWDGSKITDVLNLVAPPAVDERKLIVWEYGTNASRPAASTVGQRRMHWAEDLNQLSVDTRDDGWVEIPTAARVNTLISGHTVATVLAARLALWEEILSVEGQVVGSAVAARRYFIAGGGSQVDANGLSGNSPVGTFDLDLSKVQLAGYKPMLRVTLTIVGGGTAAPGSGGWYGGIYRFNAAAASGTYMVPDMAAAEGNRAGPALLTSATDMDIGNAGAEFEQIIGMNDSYILGVDHPSVAANGVVHCRVGLERRWIPA